MKTCEICKKAESKGKVVTANGGLDVCPGCMLEALDRKDVCTIGESERLANLPLSKAN